MYTAKEIIAQLSHPNKADCELMTKAYDVAAEAHKDHTRYSGEPYMVHTAEVGYKLASMGIGPRTVCAGLLHDTIEDTDLTSDDIKRDFGEEILFLVEGVTKLNSVRYYGSDRHNESLRKLFVATSQDIRVLIIKLVDRLHNMETLNYVPAEKQLRIAQETLEIYVPVAHRLGMGKLRKELEDLAFPYVYPDDAKRVAETLTKRFSNAKEVLEKERKILQKQLVESELLDFHTSYRVKGVYSLFHKLQRKDWDIDTIYDLLAMRIIVNNIEDCYRVQGIVHKLWRPLPKRVKDYIAFPKPNGYQSLHTTVTTKNGIILEIQIRTKQMHQDSEFGVASHVLYKQPIVNDYPQKQPVFSSLIPTLFKPFSRRKTNPGNVTEAKEKTPHRHKIPLWISQIGQAYNQESNSPTSDFVADAESDFFSNRIFVFTPNGDVVDLPVGATPIDFAYAIHSEIGGHTSGAKINHKLAHLNSELKNGDIVEIETRKASKPNPKWLRFTKTSLARRSIRQTLDNQI